MAELVRLITGRALIESDRAPLRVALRLMMSAEAIAAPSRCHLRVPRGSDNPADQADFYYTSSAVLGAAGEAVRQLDKAKSRVDPKKLDPDLQQAWIDVVDPGTHAMLAVLHRVRDKYWAHRDESVAKRLVAAMLDEPKSEAIVLAASDESCETNTTAYPIVQAAWFIDLQGAFGLTPLMPSLTEAIELAHAVSHLCSGAARTILDEAGLALCVEQRPDRAAP